jgi:hypothetical protein
MLLFLTAFESVPDPRAEIKPFHAGSYTVV